MGTELAPLLQVPTPDTSEDGKCSNRVCGIEYSTLDPVGTCPLPNPPEWEPLLQIPAPEYCAVKILFLQDARVLSCNHTSHWQQLNIWSKYASPSLSHTLNLLLCAYTYLFQV